MSQKALITREFFNELHDRLGRLVRKEVHTEAEFWLARELAKAIGYGRWPAFVKVIDKAIAACAAAGHDADEHFLEIIEIVPNEGGPARVIEDYALTRYACYLIAQNADANKAAVAYARLYFAVHSPDPDLVDAHMVEAERINARKKLSKSEKTLSGLIYERVENERGFSRIRMKGDQALFGGATTRVMKKQLGVPKGRALADYLPTIALKAKDFANEITNFNVKRAYLHTEAQITREHVKNNRSVRRLLKKGRIVPEKLAPAEDYKKLERRAASEAKKLASQTKRIASAH
ncbi:MAG: DNA damage-inducible protein D [Pirellulales bacterium]